MHPWRQICRRARQQRIPPPGPHLGRGTICLDLHSPVRLYHLDGLNVLRITLYSRSTLCIYFLYYIIYKKYLRYQEFMSRPKGGRSVLITALANRGYGIAKTALPNHPPHVCVALLSRRLKSATWLLYSLLVAVHFAHARPLMLSISLVIMSLARVDPTAALSRYKL